MSALLYTTVDKGSHVMVWTYMLWIESDVTILLIVFIRILPDSISYLHIFIWSQELSDSLEH